MNIIIKNYKNSVISSLPLGRLRGALFILLVFFLSSCKKEHQYYTAFGVVKNKATGEPIEGVVVRVMDGLYGNDPVFESDSDPAVFDYDTTDANGIYHLHIKTTSNHAVIQAGKSGYEFDDENTNSQSGYIYLKEGVQNKELKLQGLAYFNSPFKKTSTPEKVTDSLFIYLLSYENISETYNFFNVTADVGEGPFYFWYDDAPVSVLGDRWLRYKLEWKTDGVWYNKIDSVFLPTSKEVYKEPIYY